MNTIPFPGGPFFCADKGRYLPDLTRLRSDAPARQALADLEIEFAILEQRCEIEEELFKLRLKQKCFVALAAAVPASVEAARGDARPTTKRSIKIFPGGLADGFHIQSESSSALPPNRSRPTTAATETVTTVGAGQPAGSQSSRKAADNSYPKGRW